MEDRLRFIKHQDKDILFVDLSDASKQDLLILLPRIKAVVTEQPRDSVLILADLSGAKIDKDVATRVKEVLVFDRPYVKKAAWVGVEQHTADTSSISVHSIDRPSSPGAGTISMVCRSPGAQLIWSGLSTGNIERCAPGVRRSSS